ncbi:MAG: GTP diphosphokinase [Pseudomonadales bacterium]|nr:GTP diphosphokinase [Pseudomonadales bacterium]
MVKVREDHPLLDDGSIDISSWIEHIQSNGDYSDVAVLQRACHLAQQAEKESEASENAWAHTTSSFETGLEMAQILADLRLDHETLITAVLYRAVREGKLPIETVKEQFGDTISLLIEGVLRMAAISSFINPTNKVVLGQSIKQLDNLRKMLVAMVDDVRVALIKLAERTCAIRALRDASYDKQKRVAQEVFDIYAPLAHRLGIGHIKWELEDLSFRYLQEDAYKEVARQLDEKRLDRQDYIEDVTERLITVLGAAGIEADVNGRAKHIYSIWRKMQRKNVDFYQIYDIRAVRVLVPTVRDCYAALGIIHGMWQHVPREFDDYIATPKENGYRSLHTAVIGPQAKVLEVQIRTGEMHDEAELGVCAHWHYKEESASESGSSYEDKIAWLRQVLEWQEELGDSGVSDIVAQFRHDVIDERVYVFTPDGHVVDMAAGVTPLDFAYSIHTEVGHRCRGAKVNGRIVPLNYTLTTGEQVEVITAKEGGPSRDWLNSTLGYTQSSRAKANIQHWFKQQDRDKNLSEGRSILIKEFHRLGIAGIDWKKVAPLLNLKAVEDVYVAVGASDLRVSQVLNALQETDAWQQQEQQEESKKDSFEGRSARHDHNSSDIEIEGVGNLMTQIAGCCKPVPGDPVLGYISQGRGVTVHRDDCIELLRLKLDEPKRVIVVDWNSSRDNVYPVDVYIQAYDRHGLLRDIMNILTSESVNIINVNSASTKSEYTVDIRLTVETNSLDELGRVLGRINQLRNIIEVRRTYSS